jgi:hypothetical protein
VPSADERLAEARLAKARLEEARDAGVASSAASSPSSPPALPSVPEARPMARRLRHLPLPLAVSAGLLVVAAIAGWFTDGSAGSIGGAAGVAVVAFGYALSSVAVAWADSVAPKLVMTVGLATYLFKFSLLGVVIFAVPRDWAGIPAMAVAMVVSVVTWLAAQVWWTMRAEVPAVTYHLQPGYQPYDDEHEE